MNESVSLPICRGGPCQASCFIEAETSFLEFPYDVVTDTRTVATYITGLPDGSNSTFLSTVTGHSNAVTTWDSAAITVTFSEESAPLVWTVDGLELTSGTTYAQFAGFTGAVGTLCDFTNPFFSLQFPTTTDPASFIVPVTTTQVPNSAIVSVLSYLDSIETLADQLGGNKPSDCDKSDDLEPAVELPCVTGISSTLTSCTTNLHNKTSCATATYYTYSTIHGTSSLSVSMTTVITGTLPGYTKDPALSLTYITDSTPRWLGPAPRQTPDKHPSPSPQATPVAFQPTSKQGEEPTPSSRGSPNPEQPTPPPPTPLPVQQQPHPTSAASPITKAPFTVSNDGSGIIVGGATIPPGAVTTVNGIPVSINPDGSHVAVGSAITVLPPGSQIAVTPLGSSPAIVAEEMTVSRDAAGDIVVGDHTIHAGQSTIIDGVPLVVLPSGNGVVIGSSTTMLPSGDEGSVVAPLTLAITAAVGPGYADPLTISRHGSSIVIDDEQTVMFGNTITADGHTIAALPSGTVVVDSATTTSLNDGQQVVISPTATAFPGTSSKVFVSSSSGGSESVQTSTYSTAGAAGRGASVMGASGLAGLVCVILFGI